MALSVERGTVSEVFTYEHPEKPVYYEVYVNVQVAKHEGDPSSWDSPDDCFGHAEVEDVEIVDVRLVTMNGQELAVDSVPQDLLQRATEDAFCLDLSGADLEVEEYDYE